tara:strand:+ start:374 stop:724 length:351 start_codon:yes stop_codon:yes gene_type:complete
MQISILEPTRQNVFKLTQEEFEKYFVNPNCHNSRMFNWNYGKLKPSAEKSKQKCPIFKDYIEWKSFTVIVEKKLQESAEYWCEFFHGGGSISQTMELENKKNGKKYVAIRSNYQAW